MKLPPRVACVIGMRQFSRGGMFSFFSKAHNLRNNKFLIFFLPRFGSLPHLKPNSGYYSHPKTGGGVEAFQKVRMFQSLLTRFHRVIRFPGSQWKCPPIQHCSRCINGLGPPSPEPSIPPTPFSNPFFSDFW